MRRDEVLRWVCLILGWTCVVIVVEHGAHIDLAWYWWALLGAAVALIREASE